MSIVAKKTEEIGDKRYSVEAKRKHENIWTCWNTTNDINRVLEFIGRIREIGFEARVIDRGTEIVENKIKEGYLIESPCKLGDKIYVVGARKIYECEIIGILKYPNGLFISFREGTDEFDFNAEKIGKGYYLSRKEAQIALKKKLEVVDEKGE